jgi:hypothetical protein
LRVFDTILEPSAYRDCREILWSRSHDILCLPKRIIPPIRCVHVDSGLVIPYLFYEFGKPIRVEFDLDADQQRTAAIESQIHRVVLEHQAEIECLRDAMQTNILSNLQVVFPVRMRAAVPIAIAKPLVGALAGSKSLETVTKTVRQD